MKRYLLLISAFVIFLSSCEKTTEGVSKETSFANFTMNGEGIILLQTGQTFTDPGVTAKEGEKDLEVAVSGQVNTAVEGVYTLNYSAVNSEGYPGTTSRTVVVANPSPEAAAINLEGNYARNTNGSLAEFTRLAPGVYSVFNPGGAPGTNLTVIAIHSTLTKLYIPEQVSSDGSITSSTGNVFNPATMSFSWAIMNPGYGTATRVFAKK